MLGGVRSMCSADWRMVASTGRALALAAWPATSILSALPSQFVEPLPGCAWQGAPGPDDSPVGETRSRKTGNFLPWQARERAQIPFELKDLDEFSCRFT